MPKENLQMRFPKTKTLVETAWEFNWLFSQFREILNVMFLSQVWYNLYSISLGLGHSIKWYFQQLRIDKLVILLPKEFQTTQVMLSEYNVELMLLSINVEYNIKYNVKFE